MSIKLTARNSREENQKVIKRAVWENPEMLELRESFKLRTGTDMMDAEKFPVLDPRFSWKAARQKSLREAESGSSFAQVLRAGVQTIVNSAYETVDTSFEEWCHVVQSSKDTELYAPLHGISFLREIGKQEKYPEARASGLDIKLKNRKYGTHFAVEKELLEDDQTGQFSKQVALMGEYAKLALEVLVMAKLASVSGMAYGDMSVPVSETQPTEEATYPWSTAMVGGGATRPASYGALNQGNIQAGIVALMNQKNKLGLKMMVRPDRLIIGPTLRFDAAVLLNSGWYPSVPSATAGAPGFTNAINPIQGIANLTTSRFMFKQDGTVAGDSRAWYLVDGNVPWFILQIRQAAEVLQENPSSGESFDRDVVRFKVSLRANADHIDPRFAWQGSDGSV